MRAMSLPYRPFNARWRRLLTVGLVAVALAVLFLAGYLPRRAAEKKLEVESSAAQSTVPRVSVMTAVDADGGRSLTLPGALAANQQALVNARATGYVARWLVDIGDRVRAGDLLAELDTPDLDQQLERGRAALYQKEAALAQANANRDYLKVTAARQDALLAEALVSQQANDQANAQLKVGEANVLAAKADVAAAQANVRELTQLVSFGRVVAPFDGRITQRNIDVGSLVTAGGSPGASGGQPLFRIEAIDPIRVFVYVPQAFALSIKDGEAASVSIRQLPGRVFKGHVARTAGTLDPATRTLDVEVDIPNPSGELLGGMFAQVTLEVAVSHRVVRVPSSAVMTDARGVHVATVDAAGQVHLVAIRPGRDNGRDVDLVDGLHGGEHVIVTPGGDIAEGMRVVAVAVAAPAQEGP